MPPPSSAGPAGCKRPSSRLSSPQHEIRDRPEIEQLDQRGQSFGSCSDSRCWLCPCHVGRRHLRGFSAARFSLSCCGICRPLAPRVFGRPKGVCDCFRRLLCTNSLALSTTICSCRHDKLRYFKFTAPTTCTVLGGITTRCVIGPRCAGLRWQLCLLELVSLIARLHSSAKCQMQ